MGRRRWGSALALAVAVLALTACGSRTPVASGSLPEYVTVGGREVPYQDLQPWTVASATSRSATRLNVFAVGSDSGGGECGPPVIRIHAKESATTIRLTAVAYEDAATPMTACASVGYAPSPQGVTLRSPIGNRTVVDASTGKARTLLVASDYPTLKPPGAPSASPLSRQDPTGPVEQVWSDGDEVLIALQTSTPAAARDEGAYGRIVDRFDIGGTPAALYRSDSEQSEVQWTPNSRQTITLRLYGTPARHWTTGQAVALARSVTNYTTEATGRLPQPATPGTAVASYSSADGPVHHAPNMWKSSGIYVGVSCEGKGTVSVALRGTTSPFTCATTLTQHVVKSIGEPNDTFFVDVTASKGVRWVVTLARASLDGS